MFERAFSDPVHIHGLGVAFAATRHPTDTRGLVHLVGILGFGVVLPEITRRASGGIAAKEGGFLVRELVIGKPAPKYVLQY